MCIRDSTGPIDLGGDQPPQHVQADPAVRGFVVRTAAMGYEARTEARSALPLDPGQIEVIDDKLVAVLRRKIGAERLEIADRLFSSARRMIVGMLRAEHPDWAEQRDGQEAAQRILTPSDDCWTWTPAVPEAACV